MFVEEATHAHWRKDTSLTNGTGQTGWLHAEQTDPSLSPCAKLNSKWATAWIWRREDGFLNSPLRCLPFFVPTRACWVEQAVWSSQRLGIRPILGLSCLSFPCAGIRGGPHHSGQSLLKQNEHQKRNYPFQSQDYKKATGTDFRRDLSWSADTKR